MTLAEFGPTVPLRGRPQTYALERAATGIGSLAVYYMKIVTLQWVLFCERERSAKRGEGLDGGWGNFRKKVRDMSEVAVSPKQ